MIRQAVLPGDTAVQMLTDSHAPASGDHLLNCRLQEAGVHLLVEFLESPTADLLPDKALETPEWMADDAPVGYVFPCAAIHVAHQTRIAGAVQFLLGKSGHEEYAKLVVATFKNGIFHVYAAQPAIGSENLWTAWLDDGVSRATIKEALKNGVEGVSSSACAKNDLVVESLDPSHPTDD
ncbi:hypothetical protein C8R43DRAFT_1230617 [Mycena crocata]|nr:hypothetical protein C8R43DRAFT_1230617 [Mycena crocata]